MEIVPSHNQHPPYIFLLSQYFNVYRVTSLEIMIVIYVGYVYNKTPKNEYYLNIVLPVSTILQSYETGMQLF